MGSRRTAPIRSKRTFQALGAAGRRGGSGPLRLRFLAIDDMTELQVAYAIPRRTGGAVVRNRIRRRLRAAVDEVASDMAPGAYLISPGADTLDLEFTELTRRLRLSVAAAGATLEVAE